MPFVLTFGRLIGRGVASFWTWLLRGGWKIAAVAAGIALVTYGVIRVRTIHRENVALQEALQAAEQDATDQRHAREEDAVASQARTTARHRTSQKEATGLARTKAALDANPDWAQQPIPADVLASLRD